jgi:hypothetical protein
MSRATPQMRDFAERLITFETGGNKSAELPTPAAVLVCKKLGPPLAALMGNTGFRMLLARALAHAAAEVPSLRAVQVNADGSLGEADKPEMQADPAKMAEGGVVLVANLLGLLAAFIGESLMLWIVHDVWPILVLNDSFLRRE